MKFTGKVGVSVVNNFTEISKKAEVTIRLSEFEIPPMQDVLIIGKRAPIGPEAARMMVDILSPDQYEIVNIDHTVIEAIVIRKSILSMISREKLLELIIVGSCEMTV